jgi:muramoyltetrapeptide carboxypeptidase
MMKRRYFLRSLSAVSASALLRPMNSVARDPIPDGDHPPVLKPRRLRKGDTVGLVAPAGFITESQLERSIGHLEMLGFRVVYNERIFARHGYFAGDDATRARDLESMFADPVVKGIFCVRGGYGSIRIIPYLDFEVIRDNPKALIGFSDITALSYVLFVKTGLVTFHGVTAATSFNEYTTENFRRVLVDPSLPAELYPADEERTENEYKLMVIRGGRATGRLVGGNLSIMVSMLGTPYDIDMSGKLVFIEEVREEPYRIDRMLTQMRKAGKFTNAAGIVLGVFRDCEAREEESNGFSLMEVLYDRLYDLEIPVIYGMSFGHIVNKLTFPVGINTELNTVYRRLTLLEEAVL